MGFKFEGKWSLLTALRLSPNPKHSFLGLGAGGVGRGRGEGKEKKEKPSPQMVLDVVPNLKTLLGSPSASNKIAGHP